MHTLTFLHAHVHLRPGERPTEVLRSPAEDVLRLPYPLGDNADRMGDLAPPGDRPPPTGDLPGDRPGDLPIAGLPPLRDAVRDIDADVGRAAPDGASPRACLNMESSPCCCCWLLCSELTMGFTGGSLEPWDIEIPDCKELTWCVGAWPSLVEGTLYGLPATGLRPRVTPTWNTPLTEVLYSTV